MVCTYLSTFCQTFTMDGSRISTCEGFFTDKGGSNGDYWPNQNLSAVICSDGGSGSHIKLEFAGVYMAPGDSLEFYDDIVPNPNKFLAGQYEFFEGKPFVIQASRANPTGCITVTFKSNGFIQKQGWNAKISCVKSCQLFQAELALSEPSVFPIDTGWIDICPGQTIDFKGKGIYPQSGQFYPQSDATSEFTWIFGEGIVQSGQDVSYTFTEPGGYNVSLQIKDPEGCYNSNYFVQRVRVSPPPTFEIDGNLKREICAKDTLSLSASSDLGFNSDISVALNEGTFETGGVRSDSLALPDGTGVSYSTPIEFSNFAPGQTLQSVDDLESICVNMEHSWMRDMSITIQCPNGTEVELHNHPGNTGGMVFLGEPIDLDILNPRPGVGYDYCWTPDATRDTWINYANTNFTLLGSGTLPAGDYSSYQNLNKLVGCPLNGSWTINVTDWWLQDNGFIFSWSINFAPEVFPDLETFTPGIVSTDWIDNSSFLSENQDSIIAVPKNAGNASYIYEITDEFGCKWDTLINFDILPQTHPDCYSCKDYIEPMRDTMVCEGQAIQLDVTPTQPTSFPVSFESLPNERIGTDNYPPANGFEAIINVNNLNPGSISNPITQIEMICFDLETDYAFDIQAILHSPNGKSLVLTQNNGNTGSYRQTCFTPSANQSITTGAAPFTGDYIPQNGDWTPLTGAQINGDWILEVSDAAGAGEFGVLNSWMISFINEVDFTYTWNNPAVVSCTNCPNPMVTISEPTTLSVETVDNFNCKNTDEVDIDFFTAPSPTVVCASNENGEITIDWTDETGADFYEINIDNQGWVQMSNSEYNFGNYNHGDITDIQIRTHFEGVDCYSIIGAESCQYINCEIETNLTPNNTSCDGSPNGSVILNPENGFGDYSYTIDGRNFQNNNDFENLAADNYTAFVYDELGCGDTVIFEIATPLNFDLNVELVNNVSCFGGNDGRLRAVTTGGTTPFTYLWNDPLAQIDQTATQLAAGNFEVTVNDSNGCEQIAGNTIIEPGEINATFDIEDVKCFGDSSGVLVANIDGGVGPFDIMWNDPDNQTGPRASNLKAGTYTITITDQNMCVQNDFAILGQPATPITSSVTQTDISCFGANKNAAELTASGGTGTNYIYSWSNGFSGSNISNIIAGTYFTEVEDENGCIAKDTIKIEEHEPLTTNMLVIPPTCNDGTDGGMGVRPRGGSNAPGTVKFQWNTSDITPLIENLAGGRDYSVTVTDGGGCKGDTTVFLPNPDPLVVLGTSELVKCFGGNDGTATITGLDGGGIIESYRWSSSANDQQTQTATGLAAGQYQVTISDDQGCPGYQTVLVDQPSQIKIIDEDIIDNNCFGEKEGSIQIDVNGGTPFDNLPRYQVDWSNNDSGTTIRELASGDYRVTVTDQNGCEEEDIITVEQPDPIDADFKVTDVICAGGRNGQIEIDASGGSPPYKYSYREDFFTGSSTLIGLTAQTYQVLITDRFDCKFFEEIEVKEPLPIEVEAGPDFVEIQLGDSVTLIANATNAVGNVDFEWSAAYDGTLSCDFCKYTNSSPMSSIIYTLYGEDENGCFDSDKIEVRVQKERKIFVPTAFTPNQDFTNDKLLVHGKDGTQIKLYRIYDRWGELIFEAKDFMINDPNIGWDGMFRSKPVNSGIYQWYLEVEFIDEATDVFKGHTTLIR